MTEDYVSFEIAKLLKEKGFNEDIDLWYDENGEMFSCHKYSIGGDWRVKAQQEVYLCPTLQMAMKWLRKKYNQNITIKAHNNVARLKTIYYAEVQNLLEPTENGFCVNGCTFKDTYEEAIEYVIKYCLENLI